MDEKDKAREYVIRAVKDSNVRFISLWFTDILGFLKSFTITPRELEGALADGMGFDGSSVEGFARIDESDMMALPDPATFRILPWSQPQCPVARMFCDIMRPGGQPFEGDPRYVLKRNLARAAELARPLLLNMRMTPTTLKKAAKLTQIQIIELVGCSAMVAAW